MNALQNALDNNEDDVRKCIPFDHPRPTRVMSHYLNNVMGMSLVCRMYPSNYEGQL